MFAVKQLSPSLYSVGNTNNEGSLVFHCYKPFFSYQYNCSFFSEHKVSDKKFEKEDFLFPKFFDRLGIFRDNLSQLLSAQIPLSTESFSTQLWNIINTPEQNTGNANGDLIRLRAQHPDCIFWTGSDEDGEFIVCKSKSDKKIKGKAYVKDLRSMNFIMTQFELACNEAAEKKSYYEEINYHPTVTHLKGEAILQYYFLSRTFGS